MVMTQEQLKDALIKTNIVDAKKFDELVSLAHQSDMSLEDLLIEKDIISDENLGLLISDSLKIPFVSLAKIIIPEDVFHIIPEKLARKYKVIPFARDEHGVKLAMTDPKNTEIPLMVAQKTGQSVSQYYGTDRDIYNALRMYRRDLQVSFDELMHLYTKNNALAEAPISKIVDLIITHAYEDKASDIHIEPQDKLSLVRFRIDGILHDMLYLPKLYHEQ
ncbi:MAG: hypothetical protein EPO02_14050, partial [Nitrospirae bacterium]